jgi:hypothetical protein
MSCTVASEQIVKLAALVRERKLAVFVGAGCSCPEIPTGEQLTARFKHDLYIRTHRLQNKVHVPEETIAAWWRRYRRSRYRQPFLLTLIPTHQSKPIGHTPCSGLVQNIFSSPARLLYVSALLRLLSARSQAKNALH